MISARGSETTGAAAPVGVDWDRGRGIAVQAALAFLALQAAQIGLWATIAPRSWYRSFPGVGRHWVEIDGPYNHHLVSDVGALFLGLAVVTIAAIATRDRLLARTAGAAWVISSVPHFLYHLTHRAGLGAADWVASLSGLGFWVGLGGLCLFAATPDPNQARRVTTPEPGEAAKPGGPD